MTTCPTFADSIKKRVEEGKNLDEIAKELCGGVKFDREKIIRIIKDFLGSDFLIQHATTLEYNVDMAKLARKRKSHKKIDAKDDKDNNCIFTKKSNEKELTLSDVAETLKELIKATNESTVISALESILHKEIHFDS